MSNVIHFPRRRDPQIYVLIEVGTITGPPEHPRVGCRRFFVSLVNEMLDKDATPLGVWEGDTAEAAVAHAISWKLPIVDGTEVGGAA